jgi:hypothetical protein
VRSVAPSDGVSTNSTSRLTRTYRHPSLLSVTSIYRNFSHAGRFLVSAWSTANSNSADRSVTYLDRHAALGVDSARKP